MDYDRKTNLNQRSPVSAEIVMPRNVVHVERMVHSAQRHVILLILVHIKATAEFNQSDKVKLHHHYTITQQVEQAD